MTIHPWVRERLTTASYVDQRVMVDGKIITSQGPGTALEFALKLVELLAGREKMEAVRKDILAVC